MNKYSLGQYYTALKKPASLLKHIIALLIVPIIHKALCSLVQTLDQNLILVEKKLRFLSDAMEITADKSKVHHTIDYFINK